MAALSNIDTRLSDTHSVDHTTGSSIPASNGTTTKTTSASSNAASSLSPRAQPVGSDNDNPDKTKRKRQPRNSACQSCAALKMKCIATPTQGVCERCSRMNRECIPAVPKPRKRRATDSFETKGVPLADLIDRASPRIDIFRPAPRAFIAESANDNVDLRTPPRLDSLNGKSFSRLFAQGLGLDDRAADYLLHGIDHNYVGQCCSSFSAMVSYFPFVVIPAAEPRMLIASRPVTTIAICTVASAANSDTRTRLSEAFRQVLANRCIMEGEQSLDLLAGLLIYLAWHHQYYKKQQIYQMLCLLAGMATDLGLQKIPSLTEQSRNAASQELQRAFVGTYYLTTVLSIMGFDRPCPLTWTASLDYFCSALYPDARETNLQAYVDLAHVLEDHTKLVAAAPVLQTASYVEMATKATLARIQTLKRTHHTAANIPAYAAMAVHIHAEGIQAYTNQAVPAAMLMQTAVATQEYLTELLQLPPLALHQMAIIDWTNLLEVLSLSTRLSSEDFAAGLSRQADLSPAWESSTLAQMLRPDVVLDAVCAHMDRAPSDGRQGVRHEGLLTWLRALFDSMKRQAATDRNGHGDSGYDAVNGLDRDRKNSTTGTDEGRFRAVNASPGVSTPATQRGPQAPWSPQRSENRTPTGLGRKGLLDQSYWQAFGDWDGRR